MMKLNIHVFLRRKLKGLVIPAKAGIQSLNFSQKKVANLDPRFRGDDEFYCGRAAL